MGPDQEQAAVAKTARRTLRRSGRGLQRRKGVSTNRHDTTAQASVNAVITGASTLISAAINAPGDKDLFNDGPKRTTPVAFGEAADIIHNRCTRCHSENPSDPVYKSAPNGVMFDTPDQIMRRAADIKQRAVTMKNMPLANVTKMTDEERALIERWHSAR